MKLSIGIVGLPNAGKSTLFKLLTKQDVVIANYPFATIDPNVGVVAVPDERLDSLAAMNPQTKKVPAVVEFVDIAGLVRGAHKGEGLGNQFLAHIRACQGVVIVLRLFCDPSVVHLEGEPDPLRDLEIIETELCRKDLETVGKRLLKIEREAKAGSKEVLEEQDALALIKAALEAGKPLMSEESLAGLIRANSGIRELQLLTAKKQLYLLNGALDSGYSSGDEFRNDTQREHPADTAEAFLGRIRELGADYVATDLAAVEEVPELITKAYNLLGLITFFTMVGERETRAWTIERGTKAREAAGVIHTDLEKKFIRAEIINWQKLLDAGSWNAAKQKGLIRLEGKDYIVQDGDVIVVRHGA